MKITCFLSICILVLSCSRTTNNPNNSQNENQQADTLHLDAARFFSIIQHDGYTQLKVSNPWQGAKDVTYDYFLVKKDKKLPPELKNATVIRTPVEKVITLSSTHIAELSVIDETKSITGISGKKYICNNEVYKKAQNGQIKDVGFPGKLNYELIINASPDIVLMYGIGPDVAVEVKKLDRLGIPAVLNGDYLEPDPLGKCEWVKFTASFFDKLLIAQHYFDSIQNKYNTLKKQLDTISDKPEVFCNVPWKGTWYMPGGNSYLAKLIDDASGDYIWRDDSSHESLSLSFEVVLNKAKNADIWLNPGQANFLSDITAMDERLAVFNPFNTGLVFNNNAKTNEHGGNDYWESGSVHPETLLGDLARIFHPEMFSSGELTYFKKLKQK